jgi:segregation and condensation protein B
MHPFTLRRLMDKAILKNILEALLLSQDEPLSVLAMLEAFEECEKPEKEDVLQALSLLTEDYADRGIELKLFASGYAFQTQTRYSPWVARLLNDKPVKYSQALMETLAIIAYRQPVTRADIEEIRGVASSSAMMKTLIERNWIRVAGHRDVPGKPAVYTTTKAFLDYFNLKSLHDLPLLPQTTE